MNNKQINDEKRRLNKQINKQIKNSSLPQKEKARIFSVTQSYRGPIPHPDILAGYQDLYPKASEEIIENALAESKHRRDMEQVRQKRRGRMAWVCLLSLVILLGATLVGSFYLILSNHEVLGTVFGSVSFISLFGSLLSYADRLSSDEQQKSKDKDSKQQKKIDQ